MKISPKLAAGIAVLLTSSFVPHQAVARPAIQQCSALSGQTVVVPPGLSTDILVGGPLADGVTISVRSIASSGTVNVSFVEQGATMASASVLPGATQSITVGQGGFLGQSAIQIRVSQGSVVPLSVVVTCSEPTAATPPANDGGSDQSPDALRSNVRGVTSTIRNSALPTDAGRLPTTLGFSNFSTFDAGGQSDGQQFFTPVGDSGGEFFLSSDMLNFAHGDPGEGSPFLIWSRARYIDLRGGGNEADGSVTSLQAGLIYQMSPRAEVGGFVIGTSSDVEVRGQSLSLDGNSTGFGLHGAYALLTGGRLSAALVIENGETDVVSGTATGQYDSTVTSFSLGWATSYMIGSDIELTPSVSLGVVRSEFDAYTLSDGTVIAADETTDENATLGLRASRAYVNAADAALDTYTPFIDLGLSYIDREQDRITFANGTVQEIEPWNGTLEFGIDADWRTGWRTGATLGVTSLFDGSPDPTLALRAGYQF